ncbi:MAG: mannitol dehydrogenase family protein [Actinoplanes sp.]
MKRPVRIVHLGFGNFFRAHAAWYTEHASDHDDWGIAAFTGRSTSTPPPSVYTLLVRGPDGSRPEVISSVSAVHPADDLVALRGYFASAELAIVTLTVTEAGYRRSSSGDLDASSPDVAGDIAALRADPLAGSVTTTPGRLVAGLLARRAADAGGLAIVPNDNVPDNGEMVARVVGQLAASVDPALPEWIAAHVSFVTTMVDRITPRTTAADREEAHDPWTVPTEPFSEWVLAGEFPGGRPDWDARFVDDVRPFEQRKLWLLNGSHSLMAYAGSIRGHETVADAIADPVVRDWVEEWWDAAAPHLPLPADEIAAYRQALLLRYANRTIRHRLAQIAADGSQKIPIRAVPVLAYGANPGATRLVAAWIAHLRGHGAPVSDVRAEEVTALARDSVEAVLAWLGLTDPDVEALVTAQVAELSEQ